MRKTESIAKSAEDTKPSRAKTSVPEKTEGKPPKAVSYTHLTLPTILLV